MRISLALVAVLFLVAPIPGAELRTLDGKVLKGELTAADEKNVTLRTDGGVVAVPVLDVLQIELVPPGDVPSPSQTKDPYLDVELTDGSLFHCRSIACKGKSLEVELVSGAKLAIPLEKVISVLREAQDAKAHQEWQAVLAKKWTRDLVAIKSAGNAVKSAGNAIEGTFGDGTEKGDAIEFELTSGKKVALPLRNIHGLFFNRKPDPAALPSLCKATDTGRNSLNVAAVVLDEKGFAITTVAGVKLNMPAGALARLDFSKGKLLFLSDLEPIVRESSTEDRIDHYRRDRNLDNGPIKLAGKEYAKGLSLHAYTDLTFDIGGEYKEFKALVGIDELVGVDGLVRIAIEGDGKELWSAVVKRKDPPRPLSLDIKGVRKLRIEVRSTDLLDLGNHIDLADAKVTK